MSRATFLLAALVVCSVAAACQDTPSGVEEAMAIPAFAADGVERHVEEYISDFTDVFFVFGCDADGQPLPSGEGELIRMEGQMYVREVLMQDAAGGYHLTMHTMPIGMRGIGVDSGEEFRVTERTSAGSQQPIMNSGVTNYRTEQKMVGLDTGRTFWIVFGGNYTVDENGDVVVRRDVNRLECKPAR